MGFPYLHRYVLPEYVFFPITDYNRNNCICNRIFFDCTGLLYQISFAIQVEVLQNEHENKKLLNLFVENLKYFVGIIQNITESDNKKKLYLFFDGKSPEQKQILQNKRDEIIQRRRVTASKSYGLCSIPDRQERCKIIYNVSKNIFKKLSYEFPNFEIIVSSFEDFGEADIKIVKTIINLEPQDADLEVIISTDTDILISFNYFIRKNILAILQLPQLGLRCISSVSLNSWLKNKSISYKRLLFYFTFFCGNDYECPIVSGTKSQILFIYEFGKRESFKVSIKNLLTLWSLLNIRTAKSVVITGLSFKVLCDIVHFKMLSVTSSLKYYSFGCEMSKNHITLSPLFNQWKLLLKNIKPTEIKKYLV